MAWRDDIAAYAENGNIEGVLRIFDELWADRARRMTNEIAYLQIIAELKGGKPVTGKREVGPNDSVLEACVRARSEATVARKAATARVASHDL